MAVDFTPQSKDLVKTAFAVNGDAQVELFHAVSKANEAKQRCAEVPDHAIQADRHECIRDARDRMFWLTDSADAARRQVLSAIGTRRGRPLCNSNREFRQP
jgi:hypothetical protein